MSFFCDMGVRRKKAGISPSCCIGPHDRWIAPAVALPHSPFKAAALLNG